MSLMAWRMGLRCVGFQCMKGDAVCQRMRQEDILHGFFFTDWR